MSKEVAKKTQALPAEFITRYAGMGLEDVSVDDVKLPRLTILQKMSPQVDEDSPDYVPGAKPGLIIDTALGEVWEHITVLPVYYRKEWIEWAPRDSGQGIVRVYERPDMVATALDSDGKLIVAETGNRLVETAQFFVLNLTAGGRKSFISMTSTQLKRARQWITYAMAERIETEQGPVQAPLFYRTYNLSTVAEQNPKGKFWSWQIERGPTISELPNAEELVREATSFIEALKQRRMQPAHVDEPEEAPF